MSLIFCIKYIIIDSKVVIYMNRKARILGCLMGGAIGDALGYQIEFERGIENREVTHYSNDFGIISDDTQMTAVL